MYIKTHVAERFGRAADQYKCHSQVQDQAAELLLQWLPHDLTKVPTLRCLDLGCGPGSQQGLLFEQLMWQERRQQHLEYVGLDLSAAMVQAAQRNLAHLQVNGSVVQGDGEALPLQRQSIDLIYSNMAMQWFNRPDLALAECARILTPSGYLLCSVVLPNSLAPLDQLLPNFVNPQRTFADWQQLIADSPLQLLASEVRQVSGHFRDCKALLKSISGVGADAMPAHHDAADDKKRLRLTKQMWAQLNAGYEGYRTPKGLPLHYHIGFFLLRSQ